VQRRVTKRGVYADPWQLIERRFGSDAHTLD